MNTISSFFNSPQATASLMKAFMAQSKAASLQSLSFFSGKEPGDTADFSQMAVDSSMISSLIQGGNTAVFGAIYKDAAAFNQSLMTSVAGAAGFRFSDQSLIGSLVNVAA